jgi:hypothetical protein
LAWPAAAGGKIVAHFDETLYFKSSMVEFSILPGLPPYGPPALSFPRPNAFREGLVVEFLTADGERWVGNFASPFRGRTVVHIELGERAVFVVASGSGYIIDVAARQLVGELAS